jgi:DNA-binding transcriptional LysR family regulator
MHAVLSLVAVRAGVSIVPESMASFWPNRLAYRAIAEPEAALDLSLAVSEPNPRVRHL